MVKANITIPKEVDTMSTSFLLQPVTKYVLFQKKHAVIAIVSQIIRIFAPLPRKRSITYGA